MTPDQAADPAPSPRRLVLLRHAKAQTPDGVADPERPLAERGVADATAAGPVLAAIADLSPPDVVLCSPALRTRSTWRLVSPALTAPPAPRFEPVVYGASVAELLALIRSVPPETRTVLVVGHEPTMSDTAEALAGPGSSPEDLERLQDKYPTSAIAVLAVPRPWAELAPGSAALQQFLVPRG